MVDIGIAGSTGYVGLELVRHIVRHPQARLRTLSADTTVGEAYSAIYPQLQGIVDQPTVATEPAAFEGCPIVFLALPHGKSAELAGALVRQGSRVIDMGADFRLRNPQTFKTWYGHEHPARDMLQEAVYGLVELYRKDIPAARLVANPGCYPTSCALAIAPMMEDIHLDRIIFDSKSGVSGAGRTPTMTTHFGEVDENLAAYGVAGTHRHTPEIEQTLSDLAGTDVVVSFTPHLIPMVRGILTTAYLTPKTPVSAADLHARYTDYYKDCPFVRIRPLGRFPATKHVYGSNFCDLGIGVDSRTGRVTIVSVIDNLVKGAAGQAVQNMNLLLGLDPATGLEGAPTWP